MAKTVPETVETGAARIALLSAVTQGNRFAVTKAIEDMLDAKVASFVASKGVLVDPPALHPMDVKRAEHRVMREEQLARVARLEKQSDPSVILAP